MVALMVCNQKMVITTESRMSRLIIAALCLFLTAGATAKTIELGDTQVRLGADKANTLSAVSFRFEVVPGLGGYTLFRNGDGERLGAPVGTLHFVDGRLVRVERLLGVLHGEDVAATIQRMIAAFRAALPAGNATIQTGSTTTNTGVSSRVSFTLPERQIVIRLYQPNDADVPAAAEISEHFQLHRPPQPSP